MLYTIIHTSAHDGPYGICWERSGKEIADNLQPPWEALSRPPHTCKEKPEQLDEITKIFLSKLSHNLFTDMSMFEFVPIF